MTSDSFHLPLIANGEDKSSPFVNCIRNTYRHLRKWARRTETNAFRLYDRELYHYPLAIDYYAGRYLVHYFAPHRGQEIPPEAVVVEVKQALYDLFQAEPEAIYWRSRIRRHKLQQYEKANDIKDFFTIKEYGINFKVNLVDYLDTGLFLDHRETRKFVAAHCKDKRVLNLFAYTASFSVHAAIANAAYTKSVDLSNTYTEWARENFILNNLSLQNNVIERADCVKFLDDEFRAKQKYEVIIIDPPTISRSKKMDQMFDVQVDYIALVTKALKLLATEGLIFFSTNLRTFVFDQSLFPDCIIQDISQKTKPLDFRDPKIHQVWKIAKKQPKT